jgi:hypothetical protein
MAQDASGGTYRTALRGLAFQLCPSFPGILLRALVALRLASEIPSGTSPHLSRATNHCCKTKNPASSAGYSHPNGGDSTRCSTSLYPVLVKNLTLGSTSRLRLILRWEDFFDPTVTPLNSLRPLRTLRPFVTIPAFSNSSSPRNNYFGRFPQPCGLRLSTRLPHGPTHITGIAALGLSPPFTSTLLQ